MENLGTMIIEKVLLFDDHRSSEKSPAISTTTLISANWKAQRDMMKDIPLKLDVNPMMRRSSTIGTGYHMRAEQALKLDPMVDAMERYNEKEIAGVWISGSFDLVYNGHLCDHKTSYGKEFSQDKLDKTTLQLSIYRWLNDDMFIKDRAFVLFVSQSNNSYESYPVELMSIEDTEKYILSRVEAIKRENRIDCMDNVKYQPCLYCSYDKSTCESMIKRNAGDFS